ncbi:MAG: MFS transporter [Dehalococcoidia bacterium]
MNPDIVRIFCAQGLRALAYGFGSVLLGLTLASRGWSSTEVGALLTAIVAGTALMSIVIGMFGDRIERRRAYALLFCGLALSGLAFGLADEFWILAIVALTGTLSTEVVESGPFTSLEQAMIAESVPSARRGRTFALYNAAATITGSVGALAAGGPSLLRDVWPNLPADQRFFLAFVPVALLGAVVALSLSAAVETTVARRTSFGGLEKSRGTVFRLSGLFAVDSFAGGFVVQSFIAYWFRVKFGVSPEVLGLLFFGVGVMQTASFLAAGRLGERFGLLNTMVFSHIPSNIFLAAIAFAPSLPVAIALLLGRQSLSQMDVPTRQAYIANLVDPAERTSAAAYTNTARYLTRPIGPALAGAVQQIALGAPFVIAGTLKVAYDLTLWAWFRRVPLEDAPDQTSAVATTTPDAIAKRGAGP